MDLRIQSLPPSVRRLPFAKRQEALQLIANRALHRRGICPIGVFWAGNQEVTVGVYRHRQGYWYISNNFSGEREDQYAEIVAEEIASAP